MITEQPKNITRSPKNELSEDLFTQLYNTGASDELLLVAKILMSEIKANDFLYSTIKNVSSDSSVEFINLENDETQDKVMGLTFDGTAARVIAQLREIRVGVFELMYHESKLQNPSTQNKELVLN
jgi:hypothetical protein